MLKLFCQKEELTKKWMERSQMKRQWAGKVSSLHLFLYPQLLGSRWLLAEQRISYGLALLT